MELVSRGIGALCVDLRGHGESNNLGRFIPFDSINNKVLQLDSTYHDIIAAFNYLITQAGVDADRIGAIGASYSGEGLMEAVRAGVRIRAAIALSPGSFSDSSIAQIEKQGLPFLFVKSHEGRSMQLFEQRVYSLAKKPVFIVLPGRIHATDLLTAYPYMNAQLAFWLEKNLGH